MYSMRTREKTWMKKGERGMKVKNGYLLREIEKALPVELKD